MTELEFLELQQKQQNSGLRMKAYFKQVSIPTSTYHYWRRKYHKSSGATSGIMAPISVGNTPCANSASYEGITCLMKQKSRNLILFLGQIKFFHTLQQSAGIRVEFVKFLLRNIPDLLKTQLAGCDKFVFAAVVKHDAFLHDVGKEIPVDFQVSVHRIDVFHHKLGKGMATVCKEVMIFVGNAFQLFFHGFGRSVNDDKYIVIALIRSLYSEFYFAVS